jgi:hypothetical protein
MKMVIPTETTELRKAAARVVERLALTGYNNDSIEKVDAWVGSPEFNGDECGAEAGAYLGEAIIKRHGGSWLFVDGAAPQVKIERNGLQLINPFGKVAKRVANGREDHLLALVNLVEHVASESKLNRDTVLLDAGEALALIPTAPGVSAGKVLLAVTVVPVVVFIALLAALGLHSLITAAIGAIVSIPLALFVLQKLANGPRGPVFLPGTLGWEAQLSMGPLSARLAEVANKVGEHPNQKQLAEVAFYSAQMRKLAAIVARRDASPGRGYVGFDTFGQETSSWPA